jgi:hypothetical protein
MASTLTVGVALPDPQAVRSRSSSALSACIAFRGIFGCILGTSSP